MSETSEPSKAEVILHVDDDEANRYAVTRLLRKAGYQVIEASTGYEALEKCASNPDLVILDVRLPDISGFEVCRRMKSVARTAKTPVLHLSASLVSSVDKARGLDTGADAYLIRPVEPVELLATVNALLRTRRAEEALRQSEERYRTLVDSVKDYAILTLDAGGKVTSWNKGSEQLLGWKEEEILGKSGELFFTDEDRAAGVPARELATAAARGATPDVRWHQRKDGSRFFADGTTHAMFAHDGRLIGFSKVARDDTERRLAELTNANLAAMVRASRDAIFQVGPDNVVRSWNPAAQALYGYAAEEIIGRPVSLLAPPDRITESDGFLERLHRGEPVIESETVRRMKDGRLIDVQVTLNPIFDADRRLVSIASTARDIGERKRVELERQKLLEQERSARESAEAANRLKDEFLATLSHELRTPLNAIVGWASILRGDGVEDADYTEGLETIERNAKVQAQLIEDLLDVSRIISGKLRLDVQQVALSTVIDAALGAMSPAAMNKGVILTKQIDEAAGPVWGDPGRLQQVVWNLLSNAIKFTPRGGTVAVKLTQAHSNLEISVSDSGRGISADFLPFVFERFRQADATTTRRFGGLGLGLAIVRHLVELHGGTVDAVSQGEGKGATFTVYLPHTGLEVPQDAVEHIRPASKFKTLMGCPEPELGGVRVLVVDDEPDARNLLKRVFEQCEMSVHLAASVDEAIALLQGNTFDVLISDIGMPTKDGYELIRHLRAMPRDQGGLTPAIALTAFAGAEDRRKALDAGFQVHVPKPVEATELLNVIAGLSRRTVKPT